MFKNTIKSVALLLAVTLLLTACGEAKKTGAVPQSSDYTVALADITSSITGTATIQPSDQYAVTALVSGEVMSAPFEEGDMVEKDQLLYKIDSSDIEKNLRSANISMQQAQNSYDDVLKSVKDLKVLSTATGKIRELFVKKGD
ncbi:MAG: biotin/lipoyl-binding protein, partial [Clostridia bacterium]|nr:biotin/lipoyl-binding protein [Clostridia bacterium]